jgi:ABC-2 type transport system permease protein
MSAWKTVWLVMEREFVARRRATAIITAILVLVALGGMTVIAATTGDGAAPARIPPEEADEVLGFLGVVILFMAIIMTGQVILLGVAEEKNSRVAEVVLGAMRPRLLLTGKVASIGLLGLFEVLLTGALVLLAGSVFDTFELPDATGGAVAIVVLWFVLGFGFYATVYGAAGALVARHQNAANAAGPINIVLMVGYFIGVASTASADNPVVRIAAVLPPLAPVTMPLRMIAGEVTVVEIVASIVLIVAAAYGLMLLAERVYSGGLLRGGKVGVRDALRGAIR